MFEHQLQIFLRFLETSFWYSHLTPSCNILGSMFFHILVSFISCHEPILLTLLPISPPPAAPMLQCAPSYSLMLPLTSSCILGSMFFHILVSFISSNVSRATCTSPSNSALLRPAPRWNTWNIVTYYENNRIWWESYHFQLLDISGLI